MGLPDKFISCDWGTSNFRLRLVDSHSLKVLSEIRTDLGIKKCYQLYKQQSERSQESYFADYLLAQLENLDLNGVENYLLVASGMLSSSIGMQELEYCQLPIAFSGEDLISNWLSLDGKLDLLLISGARTNKDVMRGEEIQAIGLSDYLPKKEKGVLLLPGTHSKHIYFDTGRFIDFTTYMTGELFEVISKHTILSASVEEAGWNPSYEDIFVEGVKKGVANQQMASLFSIRANSLIHKTSAKENYYYLSGLLIGAELGHLKEKSETVYLAVTGIQNELYQLALKSFLPMDRIVCFDPQFIETALLVGQLKILEQHVK
ncbi:2-dehydro-3-deoxygalactonokinase [Arenibacter sp. BSSL-BM3]|uniref:2-dehydro-3-deoxygalactonokinase n=1 Tax=Arenibacter arenosicollis TaxID=2762274 RepID=A0ABR7QL50_9FLAO|nr:2-dehydro-3-deoxygalactonokinase [Arenibacter arenosicollis]MBC8767687.1 2-dehydro-3-deoxygalactonokinase [Arenibacter arenosicollis]